MRKKLHLYSSIGILFCMISGLFWVLVWFNYSKYGRAEDANFLQPYAGTALACTAAALVALIVLAKLLHTPDMSAPKRPSHAFTYESMFPEELETRLPPVVLQKLYDVTDPAPHSWIGGAPPACAKDLPRHPDTGAPLNHMLTVSLSQLAPFMEFGLLPNTGQLSFYASPLDNLPANTGRYYTDGFAVRFTAEESPPDPNAVHNPFAQTPIGFAFATTPPPTQTPMYATLSDSHQMFGEGLDIQEQLFPVHDREMLLQLGNDDDIDLRVSGVMQFMMYPDDLRAHAWDRAVVVMAFD